MKRGTLTIHSCPLALIRHVEWAIQNTLGASINQVNQLNQGYGIHWRNQPLVAGTQRTQIEWREPNGNSNRASELASALKSWHYLKFEITCGDQFFRFTPELGLHRALIDEIGNILLTENQIRSALSKTDESMRDALDVALGTEWEVELERLRGVDLQEVNHLRAI